MTEQVEAIMIEGLTDSQMIANLAGRVATLEQRVDLIKGKTTGNWPIARVRFDAPVGTDEERAASKLWPGAWFDATGYATLRPNGDYHTGVDLNLPNFKDTGEIVRACADGVVMFSGQLSAWGYVVVVEHTLDDQTKRWSRYAHLNGHQPMAVPGAVVKRGEYLAVIGDYGKVGPQEDHVHYDIAKKNLSTAPGDWPGNDKARVLRDYEDPLAFTRDRHG